MKTIELIINKEEEKKITIYPTDSIEDVAIRIKIEIESSFPEYVIIENEGIQIPIEKKYDVVDLIPIFRTNNIEKVIEIYNEKIEPKKYFTIQQYLSMYSLFIYVEKGKNKLIYQSYIKSQFLKDNIFKFKRSREEIGNFEYFLREILDTVQKEVQSMELKKKGKQWKIHNEEAKKQGTYLESIPPYQLGTINEKGKITTIEIKSKKACCFQIFHDIILNDILPICYYEGYYKFLSCTMIQEIFEKMKKQPTEESPSSIFNIGNGLSIFDKNGDISIYVQNRKEGIEVQFLLEKEGNFPTIETVIAFLHLQNIPYQITSTIEEGILAEFELKTPPPMTLTKGKKWNGIFCAMIADLCMNDPIFSKFFWLNESEKISRESVSGRFVRRHDALYLYFLTPPIEKETKKNEKDIFLEGWNRTKARYGELSCILYPTRSIGKEEGWMLKVRINRSSSFPIIELFRVLFSRLISFYYQQYNQEYTIYQRYIPYFTTARTQGEGEEEEEEIRKTIKMTKLDPTIFTPHLYSRCCQNGRIQLIEKEEVLRRFQKEEEYKYFFQFPPAAYRGIEPKIYECSRQPFKDKVYAYPGLIKIKNVKDHPFGVAPCCYIEDHTEQNKTEFARLYKKIQDDFVPQFREHKALPVSFRYVLSSEKIINEMGNTGILPNELNSFFYSLDLDAEYYRVGSVTQWSSFSLLACLEYWYAIVSKKSHLRHPVGLKKKIMQEVGWASCSQETFNKTREEIQETFFKGYMDPRQYYRILEEFYNVRIVIFEKDLNGKIEIMKPNCYQFYSISSLDPSIPIICLYLHFGGTSQTLTNTSEPICEWIIQKKGENDIHYSFSDTSFFQSIFQSTFSFFQDKMFVPIIPYSFLQELKSLLDPKTSMQWFDIGGKTWMVRAKELFLLFVPFPILPFSSIPLSSTFSSIKIPYYRDFVKNVLFVYLLQKYSNELFRISSSPLYFLQLKIDDNVFIIVPFQSSTPPPNSNEEMMISFQDAPVYYQYFILSSRHKEENSWEMILRHKIYATVLQDKIVYSFSCFLDRHKKEISRTRPTPEQLISSFLSNHASFDLQETEYLQSILSPVFSNSSSSNQKINLPENSFENVSLFLQWIYPKILSLSLESLHEIPTFFQTSFQVPILPFHGIQKSTTSPLPFFILNDVLRVPIEGIMIVPDKFFYYFYPSLSPLSFFQHPCMVIRKILEEEQELEDLLFDIGHYLKSKTFQWNILKKEPDAPSSSFLFYVKNTSKLAIFEPTIQKKRKEETSEIQSSSISCVIYEKHENEFLFFIPFL